MDFILEFIVHLLAHSIYGKKEDPRHPLWRWTFITIFFGLSLATLVGLAFKGSNIAAWVPILLLAGLVHGMVALYGEALFGSKRISFVIGLTLATSLGAALIWS